MEKTNNGFLALIVLLAIVCVVFAFLYAGANNKIDEIEEERDACMVWAEQAVEVIELCEDLAVACKALT